MSDKITIGRIEFGPTKTTDNTMDVNVPRLTEKVLSMVYKEKVELLERERDQLRTENEALKVKLGVAVDAIRYYGHGCTVGCNNCDHLQARQALQTIQGEK